MEASVEVGDLPVVVSLSGELDASDPIWAEELESVVAEGQQRVVVDLLDVSFVDSSVVQALVQAHKRVGEIGWVRVVYTHHLIKRVLQICGLGETFPQFTSVDAAVRAVPARLASARSTKPGERR